MPGMPPMPRIICFMAPGLLNFFIIFCICSNCLSKRFTSCICLPEPIAIRRLREPMINLGTKRIEQLADGWTILTKDRKPSAHFEHDVAIVDGKPKLLSTFDYIYTALGIESNEEDEFRFDS